MDFITNLYLQILNLIKELLTVFGADTTAVDGLIDNFNKVNEDEETETL